jgi:hypothetical protein
MMDEQHKDTVHINSIGLKLDRKFLESVKMLNSRGYETYVRWDIAREEGMQTHLVVNNVWVQLDDVETLASNQVTLDELRAKYSR